MREQIERIFRSYAPIFSGACLVKSADTILLTAASGMANKDHAVRNNLDTLFDTASVTKTFTAVATIMLVEKGLLRLDEYITDVIDLSGTKIPSDVTIDHLLTHTSGIADDADEEAGESYEDLFVDKPNYAIRNCIDFLPQFAYKEPIFRAGESVRYNNCAYVLLGLAIEKRAETDFRGFITKSIFETCGMHHTHFYAKDEICPGAAEGYFAVKDKKGTFVKWKKNIYSYPPIGTPDGGAFTTVGDLDIFLRAIKERKILSDVFFGDDDATP